MSTPASSDETAAASAARGSASSSAGAAGADFEAGSGLGVADSADVLGLARQGGPPDLRPLRLAVLGGGPSVGGATAGGGGPDAGGEAGVPAGPDVGGGPDAGGEAGVPVTTDVGGASGGAWATIGDGAWGTRVSGDASPSVGGTMGPGGGNGGDPATGGRPAGAETDACHADAHHLRRRYRRRTAQLQCSLAAPFRRRLPDPPFDRPR